LSQQGPENPPHGEDRHGQGQPGDGEPAEGRTPDGGSPGGGWGVPPAQPWQVPASNPWSGPPQWGTPPPGPFPGAPLYGQAAYQAPPKPGTVPLRPLMFGEILDGSLRTIRRNPKPMLGSALLAQAFGAVFVLLLTAVAYAPPEWLEDRLAGLTEAEGLALGIGAVAAFLLFTLPAYFISVVLQGVMAVPVARSMLNRETGFGQMWSLARSGIGPLVGIAALLILGSLAAMAVVVVAGVVLVPAVGGLSLLIILPLMLGLFVLMVWIYIKLLVAPAAVVVEQLGAVAGLKRSWQLTKGSWWRILGIIAVVVILINVVSQIVLAPLSLLTGGFGFPIPGEEQGALPPIGFVLAAVLASAVVGALAYAFQTSVMALLYMDLRMRQDGLDITLLRLLETGAEPDGVPGRVHYGPGGPHTSFGPPPPGNG
jgi:hypothetical protein